MHVIIYGKIAINKTPATGVRWQCCEWCTASCCVLTRE